MDEGAEKDKEEGELSEAEEAVKRFLVKRKRADHREITLRLKPSILDLYFGTLLGEGKWTKEARRAFFARYFLTDDQQETPGQDAPPPI